MEENEGWGRWWESKQRFKEIWIETISGGEIYISYISFPWDLYIANILIILFVIYSLNHPGTHLFRLYISEPPGWYKTIHIYEAYMFFALQGSVQPVHGFSRWDNLAASEVGRSENPLKDLQASRRSYFFWPGLIFAAGEIRCSFEVNFFSQLSLCHLMTTQRSGD